MAPRRAVFAGPGGVLNAGYGQSTGYGHAAGGDPPRPPPPPFQRDLPPDAPPVIPDEDQDPSLWIEIQRWETKNVPLLDPDQPDCWW